MNDRDGILLVDDDQELAAALGEFLEREGYPVTVAGTVEDGLAALRRAPVSTLLLDLRLPDGDGLVVMREAQRLAEPPDVVIVTGHATLDSAIAAVEAGAAGYVLKPVDLPRLGRLLERLTERRRLLGENARLSEAAQRDRQRLQTLYGVARQMAAAHDPNEILNLIVNEAVRLLAVEAAGIRLLEGDELVLRARTESAAVIMSRTRVKVGESLSGRAVAEGRPITVEDLVDDPRYDPTHRRAAVELGMHGFVAVPLHAAGGRVIGALNVYTRQRRRFTDDEVTLLATFADQAATALEKARLYTEAETQRRQVVQIFESTSDGIVFVGLDGHIQSANERAAELLGFSANGAGSRTLAELLDGDAAGAATDRSASALSAALASPDREGEGDLVLPGRVLHWVARPTRHASEATLGLTLTVQDVTREREISQMKSEFVSFVTHQLRTPLAGIKWLLELSTQQETGAAEAAEYVQDARASAERLIRLVNDLLDVARLESGRFKFDPRPTHLGELTQSVLDEVAPLVRDRGHRVSLAGAAEIPRVAADAQLLRQVVLNLVSNAIKYTPGAGDIAIRMDRDGDAVLWAVRDSGVGVPQDAQHRLFEKFFRADNALSVETEGTGLGLYMVRLIVKLHGGQVWYESEEGRGSTFSFRLPVVAEEAA
ncbi:MAG: GAF domain-containing protein [Candidatus Rokubacteria bacterium]|nr:GAF domain-containing protein [Candidatus Rokubacteria bacterium]